MWDRHDGAADSHPHMRLRITARHMNISVLEALQVREGTGAVAAHRPAPRRTCLASSMCACVCLVRASYERMNAAPRRLSSAYRGIFRMGCVYFAVRCRTHAQRMPRIAYASKLVVGIKFLPRDRRRP
jgi:hypothetical protein